MALDKRKQRRAIASNQITRTARQPLSDIIWRGEADVKCSTMSESGQPFWITVDFWCTFRKDPERDFGLKPRGAKHTKLETAMPETRRAWKRTSVSRKYWFHNLLKEHLSQLYLCIKFYFFSKYLYHLIFVTGSFLSTLIFSYICRRMNEYNKMQSTVTDTNKVNTFYCVCLTDKDEYVSKMSMITCIHYTVSKPGALW